jgi:hypothetical protein
VNNTTVDLSADVIDVRDIIARVEALEDEIPDDSNDTRNWADSGEFMALCAILDELKGAAGDEQWRGDWYPVTLIRDSHFTDYARELAHDVGAVDPNAKWPQTCINWAHAARELQYDYTGVQIDGVTYWYR